MDRRLWGGGGGDGYTKMLGDYTKMLGDRYDDPAFDRDTHYLVTIEARHAGSEDWPILTPRLRFPFPPDKMDQMVPLIEAKVPESMRATATGWLQGSRVRLVKLRTADLNGQTGTVGTFDHDRCRWNVVLDDGGRVVGVKPENLVDEAAAPP